MPQFSEDEAQRIFARAAERQHAANDEASGFSLDELQEIGLAAGLSPEHIAAAVAEVKATPSSRISETTVTGVLTEIRRSRVVDGEMTDEMWERMVSMFRRTFKTKGITASVGRAREWTGTDKTGSLSNLHVVAAPVEGGTRITLETSRTEEAQILKALPFFFSFMVFFFPLLGATQGKLDDPTVWVFAALMSVIGIGVFWSMRWSFQRWSEMRKNEFDALLEHFELIVQSGDMPGTESESSTSPVSALKDALHEMADAPDAASGATRSRTQA